MSKTVETPQISRVDVLASGLDSPRKLNFGSDGALYVAEAGRGGTGAPIPSPSLPGASLFYGATGAITRIQNGVAERVVTGLPSLALPDGSDAAGVNDIEFDAYGNAYAIVGLASNPANRDSLLKIPDFSQLIQFDSFDDGGSWTLLRDFGAYEQNNNPDGQDVNTNLYDLLLTDNIAYVLDAGANDLLSVQAFGGEINLEAVFPTTTTIDPLTGKTVVRQPVPTSVTVGPSGALYVGQLTGFPFQTGTAQVYRLNALGQPEVYAGGFTNISDIAFDKSGGLYVLEYDADGILNGSNAGAYFQTQTNSGAFPVIDNQNIPVGLIAGTLDGVADLGEVASSYVKIQDPPKALIAIEGANHYGITNTDNLTRELNRPTLSQETATGAIGRWSGLFLRANLLNDQDAFNYVYNTGGDFDPNVSVISQTR